MPDEMLKIRLRYTKGSQIFSQCDPEATDKDLFEVAHAVASLKSEEALEYIKITEARLVG